LATGVLSISAFVHFADRVCAGHLGDQRLQAQTTRLPTRASAFDAVGHQASAESAYCVGANFAVAVAYPIGPPEEMVETIGQFRRSCEDNGWGVAFHQTLPDLLPVYRKSGFKRLKIGDEAIVDLTNFTYRHALDLPKVGVALGKVSDLTE
ncbi:MAG TPA: phosphatidylglycerol lysyltransferase domain-containing protein, partial [Blastocatellia bacterium]|nr:phosphatidylglycerol lysyltransferase domain-containing protein [Blastocatellia bacterium]